MVCQIKILLVIQLLIITTLALPASPESKHEKRSISVSDPANLVEKPSGENSTAKSDVKIKVNQNQFPISEDKSETPLNVLDQRLPEFENNDFKIEVLNLPSKGSNVPQFPIGSPIGGPETHIIKVPEPYIIRVPHYIILREPQLTVNRDHFAGASFPGSFYPFGEFSGITQGFPSGENIFDISQIYPSNPFEISQGFEGFPPISGASEIQGFPGFGDISQGFEIYEPETIPTVGIDDQKIDHDSDSVIVDSLNFKKSNKNENSVKNETPTKKEDTAGSTTEPSVNKE